MPDLYGHTEFVILVNNNRRRCYDVKSMLLLTVISVPVLLFCGIYMLILSSNEKVIYPKIAQFRAPELWLNRAKIYATHRQNNATYTHQIHLMRKSNHKLSNDDFDDFRLVCYYNFPGDNELSPSQIDPNLCTHLNLGFTSVQDHKLNLTAFQRQILQNLVALKAKNRDLKVLLSVGGAGNDAGFSEMVRNHTNRKTFIRSVLDLVRNDRIDGVDLDWEFPNEKQDGDRNQKMHFTQLLEEFRKTIDKQTKHKFLVTVAVASPPAIVDGSYDVTYMSDYVDYVNLMSYDCHFFTKFTPFTGFNAPLYKSESDGGYFAFLNINYTANYWVSKGMDRRKIVVGLPTYGHSFKLVNVHNNGLYAPARGYGKLGTDGFADYNQICKFLETNKISPVFDSSSKSPYASKSVEWISFDNELSLSFKAEFVRDNHFGGAMIYSLNTDDYAGICNTDKNVAPLPFPLTRRVREVLSRNYSIF